MALTLDSEEENNRKKSPAAATAAAANNAAHKSGSAGSGDIYRNLGTLVSIEIGVDKPLLEKKKLQPVFTASILNYDSLKLFLCVRVAEQRGARLYPRKAGKPRIHAKEAGCQGIARVWAQGPIHTQQYCQPVPEHCRLWWRGLWSRARETQADLYLEWIWLLLPVQGAAQDDRHRHCSRAIQQKVALCHRNWNASIPQWSLCFPSGPDARHSKQGIFDDANYLDLRIVITDTRHLYSTFDFSINSFIIVIYFTNINP